VTSGGIEIGAAAVAPLLPAPDSSETQPLLPERGCFCVQRPAQRLVVVPPDDEAAIDR
jgi:hypothetical protein